MPDQPTPVPQPRPTPIGGRGPIAFVKSLPRPVQIGGGVVILASGFILYRRWKANRTLAAETDAGRFADVGYGYQPGGFGGVGGGGGFTFPPGTGTGTSTPAEPFDTSPFIETIRNLEGQLQEALRPTPASEAGERLIKAQEQVAGIFGSYPAGTVISTPERQQRIAAEVALGRQPANVQQSLDVQSRLYQTYATAFGGKPIAGYGPTGQWENAEQRLNRLVNDTIQNKRGEQAILTSIRNLPG